MRSILKNRLLATSTVLFRSFKFNRSLVTNSNFRSYGSDIKMMKSVYPDIVIPNTTVGEVMWRDLHLWPDRTALVCGVTGRQIKYHELYKMSKSVAVGLRKKLKVENNDCLAIMMPNYPEFPIAALGALDAGCIVSTINIMYTKEEVKRQLMMSGAKFILTTNSIYDVIKHVVADADLPIRVIIVEDNKESIPEGTIRFSELAYNLDENVDCLKEVNRNPEDVAFLPYSSGTTGMPKGVQLSHKNVVASICQQTLTEDLMLTFKCTSDFQDSLLCIVPFFHISGLMVQMMSKLAIGNKLITMPRFRPEEFLRLQLEHRTTAMVAAPPLALFLANYPEVTQEHMASFRNLLFGAAPTAENDLHRITEKGHPNLTIAQGYGLTESTGVVMANKQGNKNYASCGYLLANTKLQIVSTVDNATLLGPNQIGELWINGPQIMKTYKDNPEATSEAFSDNGWLKTGDLGYCDSNSEFYIVDRLKDLIKVKGYQVAPAELEGVLRSHPKIGDAAVIGVPHEKYGETPKAYVVVEDDISEEEIKQFVAERVAPYKHIGLVEYIDEIPKSPAGKILRKELKC